MTKGVRRARRILKKATGIEGGEELAKKLEGLTGTPYTQRVVDAINEWAVMLRDRARQKAPLGPTGNLRRSIFADRRRPFHDKWQPSALAGVNASIAPHAHLVEFGTVKMSARPFFRPAAEETAAAGQALVRRALEASIKEAQQSRVRPLTKPPVKING